MSMLPTTPSLVHAQVLPGASKICTCQGTCTQLHLALCSMHVSNIELACRAEALIKLTPERFNLSNNTMLFPLCICFCSYISNTAPAQCILTSFTSFTSDCILLRPYHVMSSSFKLMRQASSLRTWCRSDGTWQGSGCQGPQACHQSRALLGTEHSQGRLRYVQHCWMFLIVHCYVMMLVATCYCE